MPAKQQHYAVAAKQQHHAVAAKQQHHAVAAKQQHQLQKAKNLGNSYLLSQRPQNRDPILEKI